MPADVEITPIERNVGVDANGGETVVDEFLFSFTHTAQMDWMLPGVPPTGKKGAPVGLLPKVKMHFTPLTLQNELLQQEKCFLQ